MKPKKVLAVSLTLVAAGAATYAFLVNLRPTGLDGQVYTALYPASGGLRGDVQLELPVAAQVLGLPSNSSIETVAGVVSERLKVANLRNMDAQSEACYVLQADKALSTDLVRARLKVIDKVLSFRAASDVRRTNCAGLDWVSPFHLLRS